MKKFTLVFLFSIGMAFTTLSFASSSASEGSNMTPAAQGADEGGGDMQGKGSERGERHKWCREHREECRAKREQWCKDNPDKCKEKVGKWCEKHPEMCKQIKSQ